MVREEARETRLWRVTGEVGKVGARERIVAADTFEQVLEQASGVLSSRVYGEARVTGISPYLDHQSFVDGSDQQVRVWVL